MRRKPIKLPSISLTLSLPVMRETSPVPAPEIRTPADTARHVAGIAANLQQETFFVLTLNTKYRLLDCHMIGIGILDACLVHPREVYRPAIMDGAAAIIVCHNHPSGDPTPSAEDIRLTRTLNEAAGIIGINLLDHVVIGRPSETNPHGFTSLRESGLVQFKY